MRFLSSLKIRRQDLGLIFVWISFFYAYFGIYALWSYPVLLSLLRWRFALSDAIFLIIIVGMVSILSFSYGFLDIAYVYRFNWGFLVFYYYFNQYGVRLPIKRLFVLLLWGVFVEFLLVNFLVPASSLPNYPDMSNTADFSDFNVSGVFQRPYSFGGNASVTGVLLVVLLSSLDVDVLLLAFAAFVVFLVGSGSGMLSYILFAMIRRFRFFIVLSVAVLPLFSVFSAYAGYLNKIGFDYIAYLYELKLHQFMSAYASLNPLQKIFGEPIFENMGGDFIMRSFFVTNGWFGITLFLWFVGVKINRLNWLPLLLMVVFSFHYFVLFSVPGQILFGYFLAQKSALRRSAL